MRVITDTATDRYPFFPDRFARGDLAMINQVLDTKHSQLPLHKNPAGVLSDRLDKERPLSVGVFIDDSAQSFQVQQAVLALLEEYGARAGRTVDIRHFDGNYVAAPGRRPLPGGGTYYDAVYAEGAGNDLNVVLTDGFAPVSWPEDPNAWMFLVDVNGAHWMQGHLEYELVKSTWWGRKSYYQVHRTPCVQTLAVA